MSFSCFWVASNVVIIVVSLISNCMWAPQGHGHLVHASANNLCGESQCLKFRVLSSAAVEVAQATYHSGHGTITMYDVYVQWAMYGRIWIVCLFNCFVSFCLFMSLLLNYVCFCLFLCFVSVLNLWGNGVRWVIICSSQMPQASPLLSHSPTHTNYSLFL